MGAKRLVVAAFCATMFLGSSSSQAPAQILSGVVGAATGTAAGGYLTLAWVVARANTGHYLHDFHDLYGWTSFPVLIGAATGTALGIASPERLWTSVMFGSGGALLGVPVGMAIGTSISERPEAKWAGGAIGGGVGMTLVFLAGVAFAQPKWVPKPLRSAAVVPVSFSVHF